MAKGARLKGWKAGRLKRSVQIIEQEAELLVNISPVTDMINIEGSLFLIHGVQNSVSFRFEGFETCQFFVQIITQEWIFLKRLQCVFDQFFGFRGQPGCQAGCFGGEPDLKTFHSEKTLLKSTHFPDFACLMELRIDCMAFSSERMSMVSKRLLNFFMLIKTASGIPFLVMAMASSESLIYRIRSKNSFLALVTGMYSWIVCMGRSPF